MFDFNIYLKKIYTLFIGLTKYKVKMFMYDFKILLIKYMKHAEKVICQSLQ